MFVFEPLEPMAGEVLRTENGCGGSEIRNGPPDTLPNMLLTPGSSILASPTLFSP